MKLLDEKTFKIYWNNKGFSTRVNITTRCSLKNNQRVYEFEENGILFIVPEEKKDFFIKTYAKI